MQTNHLPQFDLDNIYVAKPCPAAWDSMIGDDRARNCIQCDRTVYNISGLNRAEASDLVANREGRMCVRLYRRSDGTVITKDCPKGLKEYRIRVAKFAGSVFAAVLGLFTVGQAQRRPIDDTQGIRSESSLNVSRIEGTVKDQTGASVSDAKVTITTPNGKKTVRRTDSQGRFSLTSFALEGGKNELRIEFPAFMPFVDTFWIRRREVIDFPIVLETAFIGEIVVLPNRSLIDPRKSSISTTIRFDN
jgi:hypothetical protein